MLYCNGSVKCTTCDDRYEMDSGANEKKKWKKENRFDKNERKKNIIKKGDEKKRNWKGDGITWAEQQCSSPMVFSPKLE